MGSENTEKNTTKIDLSVLMSDFLRSARHFAYLGIVLVLVAAAFFGWNNYRSYSPQYRASASFTVYVTNPLQAEVRTYNTATAEQMVKTFPYILTSGVLRDMVMRELDISAMPAVSASALENTNIFTLSVTSDDPQLAYDVLNTVISCYPSVAEFVVGPTVMNLLDESGVPTVPINSRNTVSALEKGAFVGLAAWLCIVLLFSFARSTIHNEEELKRLVNLRCMGMLPVVKGYQKGQRKAACPILTAGNDTVGFGESIRLLRIRVEKEMREQNKKVLLVSSAIPGEGKTTIATNLALALAQKGKRTLLVDCDLRDPSVAAVLGRKESTGLSAYLKGNASVKKIIRSMETENFFVVFGGTPVSNAAELLAKEELRTLIAAARSIFDYIILDTPPCSMLADASEIADIADCALMTIRQDYASRDQILEGAELLSGSRLPLIGCVLNCANRSALGGSYGYYGYGYGAYYNSYGKDASHR